ncbi:MAG: monovalent cation/H+ antiporter subunit D family protein [Paracoccaceae bacterium]
MTPSLSAIAAAASAGAPAETLTLFDQLPAAQVVLPLLGAVVITVVRAERPSFWIALAVAWATPVIAILLLHEALTGGTISYGLGGWEPPFGIEYRVDALSGFMLVLVSIMGALVLSFAPRSVAAEIPKRLRGWYYAMMLTCFAGLLGMAISGDAFNIFVFMEISSLATYVMIALGRDRRALVAAFQYLVIGTLGATFYVIGAGLLFTVTGTLNLVDMAATLGEDATRAPAQAALAFIAVGIGLKLALFPLHLWLPNAYAFAPSTATAFLASTATKVAVYILCRFLFLVYGVDVVLTDRDALTFALILAVIAMVAPSLVAIFQANVKRMLAYSSVAQIGYIILGVALLNESGLTGGISHLFNHAIIKGCLFLAIGSVVYATGITKIDEMAGLGRTMPWTMAAFVIAGLGLIGVPGTAGFVSKWYLIQGATEAGQWWLVGAIVFASILAVFYVGRVIQVAWFRPPEGASFDPKDTPWEMFAVTWALALLTLYFGLQTDLSAGVPAFAAEALLAGPASLIEGAAGAE